jgi:two-component system sensor histidine kinase FlrB
MWQRVLAPGVPLEAVVEALPAGVVVVDARGEVQAFNESAAELLGELRAGELWREVVQRLIRPRWDDGHDVTLANGRRVHIGTRAMPGGAGQLIVITDVTETRRLQDLLERHQRASELGQMAATLAHQLRTPVATAMLNCGALGGVLRGDGRERPALTRMKHALQRLERLVDNLLAFARGGQLALTPIAVAELLAWLAEDFTPLADAGFRIALPTVPLPGILAVNESALRSVLLNLAENAREMTRGHGRLVVTAGLAGGSLQLRFRDDGPGVAEAERVHIFEPFVSSRPNGTGLGLAVARIVVQAHGGSIELEAMATGGASFLVILPMLEEAEGDRA